MTERTLARRTIFDAMLLLTLCGGSLVLLNPVGDFPLNDDWSFAQTVKHFLDTGDFRPTWASMPLVTNVLWGSLFCLPAGWSYNALRASTLVASFLGVWGCYLLMRHIRRPRWQAMMTALLLAFNPIYYALSVTFMTDVAFMALFIFAALFFARNLRTGSDFDLLAGTALALAATLSRQLGIAVPIAFATCLLLTHGAGSRTIPRAVAPAALCIGALVALRWWMAASSRLSPIYDVKMSSLMLVLGSPKELALRVGENSFVSLVYLGCFMLPVLAIVASRSFRSRRRRWLAVLAIVAMLASIDFVRSTWLGQTLLMPIRPSIVRNYGIGPNCVGRPELLYENDLPNFSAGFWIAVTAAGICGAAWLLATLGQSVGKLLKAPVLRRRLDDLDTAGLFFLLVAFIYLLPILVPKGMDRYFVPAIPFLAAGIAALLPRYSYDTAGAKAGLVVAALLLAASAVFSVGCTRDYLQWNRVRWQALHDLMDRDHVSPAEINGGFEFNGVYQYDRDFSFNEEYAKRNPDKFWWWIEKNKYIVSIGDIPGYAVDKEYIYRRWLPPRVAKVVVLRKLPPFATQSNSTAAKGP